MSAVTYEFCCFFAHCTICRPGWEAGSVFLACRRVTERYHMVSWQKYKVPLAVWSTVLNLNAKSDNWVRQEKKLSSKVLFISFCYFSTFHLFFLSCPLSHLSPFFFFFYQPLTEADRLVSKMDSKRRWVYVWETCQKVSGHLCQQLVRCTLDFCSITTVLDNHLELSKSQNHGWVCLFRNIADFPDVDLFNVKGIHRSFSGLGH